MNNPRPEKSARVVQFRPRPALDAAVSAAIEARRAIGRCKAEFAALLATQGITPAEIDLAADMLVEDLHWCADQSDVGAAARVNENFRLAIAGEFLAKP
jgi:hypothetical protein